MKRFLLFVSLFVFVFLAACQPSEPQPVFTPGTDATITPVSYAPKAAKIAATLPGRIISFDISPDLKTIAFATSRGVELYDLQAYQYLRTLSRGIMISSLDWSADGKYLAVGSIIDKTEFGEAHLDIWDVNSWQTLDRNLEVNDLQNERFLDLAWSPDGQSLAVSTDMRSVMVLDLETGSVSSEQSEFASSVRDIDWSPDGSRLIATGDMAYSIRRWVVKSGTAVRLFDKRNSNAMVLAWSPDGKRIASGHIEGRVCLWTAATNKCDGLIQAHRSAVFSLAWSPDGTKLATGAGVIRIWNTQTGKLIKALGEYDDFRYSQIEWPALDQPLVTLQTGLEDESITAVRLWDITTGKIIVEFTGGNG